MICHQKWKRRETNVPNERYLMAMLCIEGYADETSMLL